MENLQPITWQKFKDILLQYPDKELQFNYSENGIVNPSYHITEIKKASITSVDCSSKINTWEEVVMQLWEPASTKTGDSMPVRKALSIIRIVENNMPLNADSVLKIEFGNSEFDARQMLVVRITANHLKLVVSLSPDKTQCKASGRDQSCGTPAKNSAEACCGASVICC